MSQRSDGGAGNMAPAPGAARDEICCDEFISRVAESFLLESGKLLHREASVTR